MKNFKRRKKNKWKNMDLFYSKEYLDGTSAQTQTQNPKKITNVYFESKENKCPGSNINFEEDRIEVGYKGFYREKIVFYKKNLVGEDITQRVKIDGRNIHIKFIKNDQKEIEYFYIRLLNEDEDYIDEYEDEEVENILNKFAIFFVK